MSRQELTYAEERDAALAFDATLMRMLTELPPEAWPKAGERYASVSHALNETEKAMLIHRVKEILR